MKIEIEGTQGFDMALKGLALNKNQKPSDMLNVSFKLAPLDNGHNKFLEMIVVWMDITAPRYWWQQFDTYRTGVTKQSQSTMHTGLKRPLTQEDFSGRVPQYLITNLNDYIEQKDFDNFKTLLPEGFLQRRMVMTNYKTLRNMIKQRKNHKLSEWNTVFIQAMEKLPFSKEYLFS